MSMVMERGVIANKIVRKDEIWLADLGYAGGSVQGGRRPVLVISNNIGNKYSPNVTVVPITSSTIKKQLPTHVKMIASEVGFVRDSIIMFESKVTIDKNNGLLYKLLDIPPSYYEVLDKASAAAEKRIFT
ncbi:type II toxin-antitoxin system PemK/MazF family toxin [Paenibacillus tianjinensis]|uniref:Type II toxin-antitoxin system PemK/MazF family toxin n=1 Tax=Paenibacillus tianjinensis TaxID=2810347 RepID=A0ABX7L8C9_9BACL|nr:type II toxin-antitoxin system PemK/MazF family toxin [Paenibacillus tianjinensis]QSF43264.1 type II toxin-antitoxin system PemK/MazF family toxin [Paenibacillus tianjinensis]